MPADLQDLEAKIGYTFRDRDLLVRALTHRSYSFDTVKAPMPLDNEQMEFLGDAVLGFVVSEELVKRLPNFQEGPLSRIKSHLVSAVHLHAVARRLDLGSFLQIGRSEEKSGGREKKNLLSNAVEALIAALHLDGGIEQARRFVQKWVVPESELTPVKEDRQTNYKSVLQERAQALKLPLPIYVTVEEGGPAHARVYVVEARVGSQRSSLGSGSSKKAAAQEAAKKILEEMDAAQLTIVVTQESA
jgi:ribonuclease-3